MADLKRNATAAAVILGQMPNRILDEFTSETLDETLEAYAFINGRGGNRVVKADELDRELIAEAKARLAQVEPAQSTAPTRPK